MNDKTSDNLAALMKAKGIKQPELAKATGVNQPTISRIINKDSPMGIKTPTDKQVRPLAMYFGVTPDQLRGRMPMNLEEISMEKGGVPEMFAGKKINDPIAWLQLIDSITDPDMIGALRSIAHVFSAGNLSVADARAIEEIVRRFDRSAGRNTLSGV